ncbi:HINT domain-containing protein [Desulfosarcina sp. OttesenSCG-928-G10]|nr:HINT domain-containing protein [Desulfosarcina sp. OttesenSCG-928-G10]
MAGGYALARNLANKGFRAAFRTLARTVAEEVFVRTTGIPLIGKGLCFVAGTLVVTPDGLIPIETLKKDDFVLSRDEVTGEITFKQIVQITITPDQPVLELSLETPDGDTETFGVTAGHPFWEKTRGWVGARELLPGDEVFTSTGGWLRVTGGTWLAERQTVYNIEVEGFHTYFVGHSQVWVHNMCRRGQTAVFEGTSTVLKKGATPNSIYVQRTVDGKVQRVAYYDENGKLFSREDYIQRSDHVVNVNGQKYNLKNHPHDHQTRTVEGPNGPYQKNQVRILDQNGKPITGWTNEGP